MTAGRRRIGQAVVAVALGMAALAPMACGGTEQPPESPAVRVDGPEHVHGLGENPRDRALMIATHSGLFRLPEGERTARRVGDLRQDTMGFTVVGPDRFLASGHPDARTGDPAQLGLIASRDGGRSWTSRSLSGEADLHALTANASVVFAVDALSGRLLASGDDGRTWTQRRSPGDAVISLVVDPDDPLRLLASTPDGVFASTDGAATWTRRDGEAGLLAWPPDGPVFRIGADGAVTVSSDAGRRWRRRGALDAEPAAVTADGEELHVADLEGRIFRSDNGGRTWSLRASP